MILAAPFVIPFAEIIGVSIAALGMAKATDKVQEFIEENPEDAIKIFAMIMPEQGLANILKNKSDDGEEISEEELGEVETPKLTGKEKGMRIKEAIRKARGEKGLPARGNYSSEDAEGPAVDIRGSVIREVEDMGMADKNLKDNYKKSNFDYKKYFRKADGGMAGDKTYHQVRDQFMPMDSESMGYANGGGIGTMMQPKKKKKKSNEPVVQGGVDNYLGKQPQVQAPRKWQSSPDKPATELAYITKAEKDLIIKKNIHGGLENGPNMGPSGIMSLDSFGDIGGAGASGGDTSASGGANAGAGFSGRNSNTTSGREFDRQKQAQRGALQNAENAQARSLGYSARDNITNIDRSNPNYNRSGIFSGKFNPLSLIAGLVGGPLAGLFTKGIMGLKNKFNDVTNNPDDLSLRERLTGYKTQAEYDKARTDRQIESRRDKMQNRIDKGYNSMFGMRTGPITDQQRSTLANLNTQTGISNNVIGGNPTSTRFSNFAPRIGLQTQPNTKSFYENEMSIPNTSSAKDFIDLSQSIDANSFEPKSRLDFLNETFGAEPAKITEQQMKEINSAASLANRMNDTGKLTGLEQTQIFNDAKSFDDTGSTGTFGFGKREAEPMTREEYNSYLEAQGYI